MVISSPCFIFTFSKTSSSFSRLLRIFRYLGTVFVCELMAILTNGECKVISKLYEVYSEITIDVDLIRWMSKEYISKISHLKYVHKRIFNTMRQIVEISDAIDALLYYLERGGKFASRNLQSGPTCTKFRSIALHETL